jgi:hypothetical protein
MSKLKLTFKIGGDLEVNRLGFGAMRLTGKGIWGEPKDGDEAKRVLTRAVGRRQFVRLSRSDDRIPDGINT